MAATAKAIETAGTVDKDHQLHLDGPLPITGPSRVRVIILVPDDGDIDETEWLRAAAANPAFDFLKHPEEDIYSPTDGRPFRKEPPTSLSLTRNAGLKEKDYEPRGRRGT